MSNRLSVVMIAKNAADLLPDCLGSVSWADEIIVLDSGSTDNTVELARRLGAQVYTHTDWRGYGIQRQRAQDYATGDWVLMIDTDERVTPELRQAILKVLDAPQRGAIYSIARRIPIASCACTNAPVTAITIIWSMNRWIAWAPRLFR